MDASRSYVGGHNSVNVDVLDPTSGNRVLKDVLGAKGEQDMLAVESHAGTRSATQID